MLRVQALCTVILAIIAAYSLPRLFPSFLSSPAGRMKSASMTIAKRAPSYFISHGGPPTMFEKEHGAYRAWLEWGKEVRQLHREGTIRGLVFVSAHWQADDLPRGVYVNVDEKNPMVYDFYGFPDFYYKQKVVSNNPSNLSSEVISHLKSNDIQVTPIKRGIDHGVWCPLKVAFQTPYIEDLKAGEKQPDPDSPDSYSALPSTLPLVQISLPRSESSIDSLKFGAALRGLRDQGLAVVGGGMSVHNLREMMLAFRSSSSRGGFTAPASTSYSKSFLAALTEAMTVPKGDSGSEQDGRWAKALKLEQRPDFRPSHPTPEHFLPALVAFGSAHNDEQGSEFFSLDEGPMGWNMYRWG